MYYSQCFFLILIRVICNAENFNDYCIYKVTAFNKNERSILYKLHMKNDNMVFLNGVTNDAALPMEVILTKSYTEQFEKILQKNNIEYHSIEATHLHNDYTKMRNKSNIIDNYSDAINISKVFLKYSSYHAWAKNMCRKYIFLTKIHIGQSYEKRDIFVLKLARVSDVKKPAVFILGGEQGRDWISPAIIINLIQMIIEDASPVESELYDFYFLPLLNPDGYDFSLKEFAMTLATMSLFFFVCCTNKVIYCSIYELWQSIFWYKNRKPFIPKIVCEDGHIAMGVNIDRNFYTTQSSSSNECDSVHPGRNAMSEEESLSLASFLNTISFDMILFINLRGNKNLITVPYADLKLVSINHGIVSEILSYTINEAYKKYNTSINFKTTGSSLYNYSGNIIDWVKTKFNTPIVYTHHITNEEKYFISADDILPLTNRFVFITKQTLRLANKMYRPLFNKEVTFFSNHILLCFCCLVMYIVFFVQ